MKYLCIWLIRFYRRFLSPLKGRPCCRFTPSCSAYALEAFEKRGFFVGFALAVWRVLRCNPFSAGGYDPVPETGFRYRGPRVPPALYCREDDGSASPDGEENETASCGEAGAAHAAENGASEQRKEQNR